MPNESPNDLLPVRLVRVLFFRDSAGVVLECGEKRFMIFVGLSEANAIRRELEGKRSERPLTHDVITYVMTAFDIEVRKVAISAIVNSVFCATLVLGSVDGAGEQREARLDIRASDSIVIALKAKTPLCVTRRVLESVEDVTASLEQIDQKFQPEADDDELEDEEG